MKEKELLTQGFEKTDDNQYVKKLSENKFHIYDKDSNGDVFDDEIDLDDYTDEQIRYYVSAYYDSLESLKESSRDEWKQVLAELIAEQLIHDEA